MFSSKKSRSHAAHPESHMRAASMTSTTSTVVAPPPLTNEQAAALAMMQYQEALMRDFWYLSVQV